MIKSKSVLESDRLKAQSFDNVQHTDLPIS